MSKSQVIRTCCPRKERKKDKLSNFLLGGGEGAGKGEVQHHDKKADKYISMCSEIVREVLETRMAPKGHNEGTRTGHYVTLVPAQNERVQ